MLAYPNYLMVVVYKLLRLAGSHLILGGQFN